MFLRHICFGVSNFDQDDGSGYKKDKVALYVVKDSGFDMKLQKFVQEKESLDSFVRISSFLSISHQRISLDRMLFRFLNLAALNMTRAKRKTRNSRTKLFGRVDR